MSSAETMNSLPVPSHINICPPAPSSKRVQERKVSPIPIQIEEVDSTETLLTEATTPLEDTTQTQDVMEHLERVFYDTNSNTLYKLFIDGTWESLKLLVNN